nr:MAG: hypothetical protein 2 [Benyviridae sp.]
MRRKALIDFEPTRSVSQRCSVLSRPVVVEVCQPVAVRTYASSVSGETTLYTDSEDAFEAWHFDRLNESITEDEDGGFAAERDMDFSESICRRKNASKEARDLARVKRQVRLKRKHEIKLRANKLSRPAVSTRDSTRPAGKRLPTESDEFVHSQTELPRVTNLDFSNHLQQWLSLPGEEVRALPLTTDPGFQEKATHPSANAYLVGETLLPTAAHIEGCTSLNQLSSVIVADRFSNGTCDPDSVIMPLNKRGHPVKNFTSYLSFGNGIGNNYSPNFPLQVLGVLNERYLNKVPVFAKGQTMEKLVKEVVDLYFDEHVRKGASIAFMDDLEVQLIVQRFVADILNKHYQEAFVGNGGLDSPTGRIIRFSLKGIFKPKTGVPDLYKAGQGISAWSTDACAMFCGVFRVLTRLVSKTERDHVCTDAYMDEGDFIQQVNGVFKTDIPYVAQNAVTDGETFDANQNDFTIALEMEYWRRLGICPIFLEFYYSWRKDYKINAGVAYGKASRQKTSGEPGTLVNNGIVSKLVSNYLVRGDGPMAIVYKGDDFCKRQCNLVVDKSREAAINSVCALRLRVSIGSGAEFCGLIYNGDNLYPSIPRKLNKIHAHRFRDLGHWQEYQQSLRDWVSRIVRYGETRVIACNADLYGTTIGEMTMAYDCINSFSHIDEEQFWNRVQRKTEVSPIPIRDSEGNLKVSF